MRFLLDTHAFLWFVNDDSSLSNDAKSLIADPSTRAHLSTASVWEMAIKISVNKLRVPSPLHQYLDQELQRHGFALLSITTEHASIPRQLRSRHRDPFDRLIVAQSIVEDIPVISRDTALDIYSIRRHW